MICAYHVIQVMFDLESLARYVAPNYSFLRPSFSLLVTLRSIDLFMASAIAQQIKLPSLIDEGSSFCHV